MPADGEHCQHDDDLQSRYPENVDQVAELRMPDDDLVVLEKHQGRQARYCGPDEPPHDKVSLIGAFAVGEKGDEK